MDQLQAQTEPQPQANMQESVNDGLGVKEAFSAVFQDERAAALQGGREQELMWVFKRLHRICPITTFATAVMVDELQNIFPKPHYATTEMPFFIRSTSFSLGSWDMGVHTMKIWFVMNHYKSLRIRYKRSLLQTPCVGFHYRIDYKVFHYEAF